MAMTEYAFFVANAMREGVAVNFVCREVFNFFVFGRGSVVVRGIDFFRVFF